MLSYPESSHLPLMSFVWPQPSTLPNSIPKSISHVRLANIFWYIYPVLRFVVYILTIRIRTNSGVPTYTKSFRRSRKIVWVLPVHVILGTVQFVLGELRYLHLLSHDLTAVDLAVSAVWSYTGLRLVKPLRRGHPPSTRAGYQFVALVRPVLEYMAWRTGDYEAYRISIAFLDAFIWVRIQLFFMDSLPSIPRSWHYGIAIPASLLFSLSLAGFSDLILPTTMAIFVTMFFNSLVSSAVRARRFFRGKPDMLTPFDSLLRALLTLGFGDLATLRSTIHRKTPEFTAAVKDEYGYVPSKLVEGVQAKSEAMKR